TRRRPPLGTVGVAHVIPTSPAAWLQPTYELRASVCRRTDARKRRFHRPQFSQAERGSTTPRSPDPTRDLTEHRAARGYNRRANLESMRWVAEAPGFDTNSERRRKRQSYGYTQIRCRANYGQPPLFVYR